MLRGVWIPRILVALTLAPGPATAAVTTFNSRDAFFAVAGPLHLENFGQAPLVGEENSGGVALLPFHGFRVWSEPSALKLMGVPSSGNHGTSIFDGRYLTGDTDTLSQSAVLTFEFEPPVRKVGFWIIDLDSFDMGVTVNGVTYVIPSNGNGGQSYFGLISDTPVAEMVFQGIGFDSHYSLDDISFPDPPAPFEAGAIPAVESGGEPPLIVDREPGGDLHLSWGNSCSVSDNDFEVYEGDLGDFASHVALLCTTDGSSSTVFTPGPGPTYYLIVPRNLLREGSYGVAWDGSERVRPSAACLLQSLGSCL